MTDKDEYGADFKNRERLFINILSDPKSKVRYENLSDDWSKWVEPRMAENQILMMENGFLRWQA